MKICWLDLETSGCNPKQNGIVSLAIIIDIDGEIKGKHYFEMYPRGRVLDPKALSVGGFTEEQVKKFTPWEKVYQDVIAIFDQHVSKWDKNDKFIFAAYNAQFDFDFLKSFFEEHGNKYIFSYIQSGQFLDPYKALPFLQWQGKVPKLENMKLATVCEALGISLENAHCAMDDIIATRDLAYKLKDL